MSDSEVEKTMVDVGRRFEGSDGPAPDQPEGLAPDLEKTRVRPPRDESATIEPPTGRHPPRQASLMDAQGTRWSELREVFKDLLKRHEKKIWWLHTCYALSLGFFVATLAQKGFERARMLTLTLVAAWILVVFFFRIFGTGAQQDFLTAWPGARRQFFIMTYLMKNLFQGMLFFLLPFYYRSASWSAKTTTPLFLLAGCAVISTLDLVFDRVLLRFKVVASAFFAVTLFGCANIFIPALLPDTSAVTSLVVSACLAIATFALFHVPLAVLRRPLAAGAVVSFVAIGGFVAYNARRAMPPVPLSLGQNGVGTALSADGTLLMELKSVKAGAAEALIAVTDVRVFGKGDSFHHVWRRGAEELEHVALPSSRTGEETLQRVTSRLAELPKPAEGSYTVDVETQSGQVVGRVSFEVRP